MTHQASKLVEMVGSPDKCRHGNVLMDGSKCLYCKHEDELAAKDVEIARMDDALADSLEINESLEAKLRSLQSEPDNNIQDRIAKIKDDAIRRIRGW